MSCCGVAQRFTDGEIVPLAPAYLFRSPRRSPLAALLRAVDDMSDLTGIQL